MTRLMRISLYFVLTALLSAWTAKPSDGHACLGLLGTIAKNSVLKTDRDELGDAYTALRSFRHSLGLTDNDKWHQPFFYNTALMTSGDTPPEQAALRARSLERFYETFRDTGADPKITFSGFTVSGEKPIKGILQNLDDQLTELREGENRAFHDFHVGQRKILFAGALLSAGIGAATQARSAFGVLLLTTAPNLMVEACRYAESCKQYEQILPKLRDIVDLKQPDS